MATILLSDVMSSNPIAISSTETVHAAVHLMSRNAIRHLVVLAVTGKPVGVVSQRDVFRHLSEGGWQRRDTELRDVMSTPLVWRPPDTPVPDVVTSLLSARIGCVPVIDGGELVGIVTRTDLLANASWTR